MALTDKQSVFVDEYLKTFNATQAAILAGYSPKTAYSVGWENLRKPEVSSVISQRMTESAMGADEVLARLADHARASMGDFWDVSTEGQPTLNLANAKAKSRLHLIKKMKVKTTRRSWTENDEPVSDTTTEIDFELYDAQAALQLLGKNHDLFIDKLQVKIEKELNKTLDLLEESLDEDTYRRVLDVISSAGTPK